MPKITFEYSLKPALNALAYLQQHIPRLTRLEAFKLLYLADKRHLELYGRPIVGGTYAALKNGPVPRRLYDYVKETSGPSGHSLPKFPEPDLRKFSDSEHKILDEIIQKYGRYSAGKLIDVSHDSAWSAAWKSAQAHGKGSEPIPWEQIIQSLDNGKDIFEALFED